MSHTVIQVPSLLHSMIVVSSVELLDVVIENNRKHNITQEAISTTAELCNNEKVIKIFDFVYIFYKVYNTYCSQAVTNPSTGQALRCLTSVIRR